MILKKIYSFLLITVLAFAFAASAYAETGTTAKTNQPTTAGTNTMTTDGVRTNATTNNRNIDWGWLGLLGLLGLAGLRGRDRNPQS
jgi:MYXO-CTERM domain-containing protein